MFRAYIKFQEDKDKSINIESVEITLKSATDYSAAFTATLLFKDSQFPDLKLRNIELFEE